MEILEIWHYPKWKTVRVAYSITLENGKYTVRTLRESATDSFMMSKDTLEQVHTFMLKMGYRRES